MKESEHNNKTSRDFAEDSNTKLFDHILPNTVESHQQNPNHFQYKNNDGTINVIKLKTNNLYHQAIFKGCYFGCHSEWFQGLSETSKPTYHSMYKLLIEWINNSNLKTTSKNRYSVLKDYESFQMNQLGKKTSSLQTINKIIREGCANQLLSEKDYEYLQTLIALSTPAQNCEPESVTLSSWFASPWLRNVIGENSYLQLESPKILSNSFRVTIATTLLYLLNQRDKWENKTSIEFSTTPQSWQYDWGRLSIDKWGNFNEIGEPSDDFTNLLWIDVVKRSSEKELRKFICDAGTTELPRHLGNNTNVYPWQRPIFFHPSYQNHLSPIEELLCSWLVANNGVQPNDVKKLRINNYAIERTHHGRLIGIECIYYKGRSGKLMRPSMLIGQDISARALEKYISKLDGQLLFTNKIQCSKYFALSSHVHSYVSLLYQIWKSESFTELLHNELKRAGSSNLFLKAMLGLEHGGEDFGHYYNRTRNKYGDYLTTEEKPLPRSIFSLTHIKNSSIHSRTDTYREADLVNHNSHSSITEKTKYLTDSNKDWINQAGRITRLVLHDLQNVVYNPSVTEIENSVSDLQLRTTVIEKTGSKDSRINSLNNVSLENSSENTIVVLDTLDTALYFTHYINQAELMLPKLVTTRPDWVERTLIVKVEWMTRTLCRLRFSAEAQKLYKNLSNHLPPLFDHMLETTE